VLAVMRKTMSMGVLLGAALVLMSVFGCDVMAPEANSGVDKDRLGAVAIELDALVLDHVNCLEGDKTDWKYFNVDEEMDVAVTFAFDEPNAGGTVVLRRATGEEINRMKFRPGKRMQYVFKAIPGHYYLEIFCEAYESEYTIEVSRPL